jgi:hypothetical protein
MTPPAWDPHLGVDGADLEERAIRLFSKDASSQTAYALGLNTNAVIVGNGTHC